MSVTSDDATIGVFDQPIDLFNEVFFPDDNKLRLRQSGTITIVKWTCEADVRGALARLAYMYGWDVQQEVVVPGWGRIDLVLGDRDVPDRPILVELKVELKRPAELRRAFQQADGYGRWWKATRNQSASVYLAACELAPAVAQPVADCYPEVGLLDVRVLMSMLPRWRRNSPKRWMEARRRLVEAERQLAVQREAIAEIERSGGVS